MTYEWKGHAPPAFVALSRRENGEARRRRVASGIQRQEQAPSTEAIISMSPRALRSTDLWKDIPPVNSQAQDELVTPRRSPKHSSSGSSRPRPTLGISSSTACAAAARLLSSRRRLGRRWIACDLGRFAVHTTRKRLLGVPDVRPFVVQNLGKYERQVWQMAEFGESAAARTAAYRDFISRPVPSQACPWVYVAARVEAGRMVHVGTVDAPVTVGDVKQIAMEFRKTVGKGKDSPTSTSVDVLGWDFAFEVNEVARQDAAKAGIDMRFMRIPREVLDKRAVDQGDVAFYELAALSVDVRRDEEVRNAYALGLRHPVDDVPGEIQSAITRLVAVDRLLGRRLGQPWRHLPQRVAELSDAERQEIAALHPHEYPQPGEYTVVVKVIDILGNDTTKTLSVIVGNGGRHGS